MGRGVWVCTPTGALLSSIAGLAKGDIWSEVPRLQVIWFPKCFSQELSYLSLYPPWKPPAQIWGGCSDIQVATTGFWQRAVRAAAVLHPRDLSSTEMWAALVPPNQQVLWAVRVHCSPNGLFGKCLPMNLPCLLMVFGLQGPVWQGMKNIFFWWLKRVSEPLMLFYGKY